MNYKFLWPWQMENFWMFAPIYAGPCFIIVLSLIAMFGGGPRIR